MLAFLIVPAAVYLATYLPWFHHFGWSLGAWWDNQQQIWDYHKTLQWFHTDPKTGDVTPTHPWLSHAWWWLPMQRPVLFFARYPTDGTRWITALGNPAVFWVSFWTLPYTAWAWWRRHDWRAALILVAFAMQYFPWFFISRPQFFFYMTPIVPFLVLAAVYTARDLSDMRIEQHDPQTGEIVERSTLFPYRPFVWGYVALAVALFVFFYPVLTGERLSKTAFTLRVWMRELDLAEPSRRVGCRKLTDSHTPCTAAAAVGAGPGATLSAMPEVRHAFVPMPDGVRLHATLYVPEGEGPWPAILEVLPYRKDDLTASYRPDYVRLAEHGYVVCRADVRGTGTSEGVSTDEYSHEERADLVALIGWLATQDWSSGSVGMYGTSYSGFNSIHARHGAAAGAEGDHPDLRDRRPLRRRRPLLRRRAEGARPHRLPLVHGGDERAAAGAGALRRGLARRMGAARARRTSPGS